MVSATTSTSLGNIKHPDITTIIIFSLVLVALSFINRYYGVRIYRFIKEKFKIRTKPSNSDWIFN